MNPVIARCIDYGWTDDPRRQDDIAELAQACQAAGHVPQEYDNSRYGHDGADIVTYCTICGYCYHTDAR